MCVKPPYDFTDEKTGNRIAGFMVLYVPCNVAVADPNYQGLMTIEKTFGLNMKSKFKFAPGIYDFELV